MLLHFERATTDIASVRNRTNDMFLMAYLSFRSFFLFFPIRGWGGGSMQQSPLSAFLNYAVSLPQFLGDGKLIMSLHII